MEKPSRAHKFKTIKMLKPCNWNPSRYTVDSKIVAIFIRNSRNPILLKELLRALYNMIQLEQTISLKVQIQSSKVLEVDIQTKKVYH